MRLAQIEMESFATKKAIFSCLKTATRGSTFLGLEKKDFLQQTCTGKLETAPKNNNKRLLLFLAIINLMQKARRV